jgi:hypothetical protein
MTPRRRRARFFLDHLENLGVAGHALDEGIDHDRPEAPRKPDLLLGRQGLAGEDDDEMIQEGTMDGGKGRLVHLLR